MSETRNISTYIKDIESDADYESAITVEHRSNNPKRDYLFVNRLQCKHIPASPTKMKNMCKDLANKCTGIKSEDKVMIVGFAETATAIGKFVAENLDNCKWIMSTTREDIEDSVEMITFEEEHSHATTQKLLTYNKSIAEDILKQISYILFVEDEISTGNTIMNFIKAFKTKYGSNFRFGVASICNWQNEENIKLFTENNIDRYYLISGKLKDVNAKMDINKDNIVSNSCDTVEYNLSGISSLFKYVNTDIFRQSRLGWDNADYYYSILGDVLKDILHRQIGRDANIRVIGSEECMAFAIDLGEKLELYGHHVVCHSTTRSCIDVIKDDYNDTDIITSRRSVDSAYESSRKTYLYNTESANDDLAVIISDSTNYEQFLRFVQSVASLFKNKATDVIAYRV